METKDMSIFDASASALGYYYQGCVALLQLFESESDDSSVSLETWDDVTLENNGVFQLTQLKHSISSSTKITIKSIEIWKTLRIWSQIIKNAKIEKVIFLMMTVASVDESDILQELNFETGRSREGLIDQLKKEAQRVVDARTEAAENGQELPFKEKYKGCEEFLSLSESQVKELINNIQLLPSSPQIKDTEESIITHLKSIPHGIQKSIAEKVLGWWQKQIIDSLTSMRKRTIHKLELQEFIAQKITEINHDGFTDDSEYLPIPPIISTHPIQEQQLNLINATQSMRRRSYNTEVLARLQREQWIEGSVSAAAKLEKYDKLLIQEWSYKFEEVVEIKENLNEEELIEKGRNLLNWTFDTVHQQIKPLSIHYVNPDLVRGSYQMLSKNLTVGWHCNYLSLIDLNGE